MGLFIAPYLGACALKFSLDVSVASLDLRVGVRTLTVVCAYATNSFSEYRYLSFLGFLSGRKLGIPLF